METDTYSETTHEYWSLSAKRTPEWRRRPRQTQKAEEGLGQMLRRLGWAGADPEKAGVGNPPPPSQHKEQVS